jgi:bifunctional non-homologous end joining protein LigD
MRLSSADKLLWPEAGFTKRDLAEYYEAAAPRLLPWLRDRPLTTKAFPRGVTGEGFFRKNAPEHAPESIRRHRVWSPSSDRFVDYLLVRTRQDLAWLANQNAIELHVWFSRVDRPDRPDMIVFDLDPSGPEPPVSLAARWMKEVLDELGLASMVKTSGKRGLHIAVPIERRYGHGELRGLALGISEAVADRHPDALTTEMRKESRRGRLLLDWSRPGPAQTLVAAWSPRAHPAGTVSMPLSWDEVDAALDPQAFTLATALARPDAWAEPPSPQRLERARTALRRQGYACEDRDPRSRR